MELVRIADLVLELDVGEFSGHIGIHVDVQLFALLDEQKLIDLVPEAIRLALLQQLTPLLRRHILLFQFRLQNLPALIELAAGDNVAIDLGHDLLDHLYLAYIGSA